MPNRIGPWLAVSLLLSGPAYAQFGGGVGGEGGGGHGGHGGRGGHAGKNPETGKKSPTAAAVAPDKPTNQIEITGVVTAIEPKTSRVTIAYDAVDELNWPHGTMPFPVAKDAMLTDLKVGEKVRFKVEEHEIYEIGPYGTPKPPGSP